MRKQPLFTSYIRNCSSLQSIYLVMSHPLFPELKTAILFERAFNESNNHFHNNQDFSIMILDNLHK